jgi:crotonobetainyl-CoA:carnitine CoA-transferase CaiB-like acyl-CoA transferase
MPEPPVSDAPGFTVLEVASGSIGASFCGRILRQTGMRVIKLEPVHAPDSLRALPPFPAATDGPPGLPFRFLNDGKQPVVADVQSPAGQALVERLLESADVLVQGGLSAHDLIFNMDQTRHAHPRLVAVAVLPLGASDESLGTDDFLVFHRSGLGYITPRTMPGYPTAGLRPLKPQSRLLEMISGFQAAIAVLATLIDRSRTGRGDRIDVAAIRCGLPLIRREMAAFLYQGAIASRGERLWKVAPAGIQACRDGYVFVDTVENHEWQQLCALMGRQDLLDDPRFADRESRFEHNELLRPALDAWFRDRSRREVTDLGQSTGVPIAPVNAPRDLFDDPQLQARGYFGQLEVESGSAVEVPNLPLHAWEPAPSTADFVGQP